MTTDNSKKPKPRAKAATKKTKNYEVGYAKPPAATQFKKGKSGNPGGRPRKPKPAPPRFYELPSESYLEEEAYRKITLRENGKEIELPAMQALLRALFVSGFKGNRLAIREFHRLVKEAEQENLELRAQRYARLKVCKREGEQILADSKRRGAKPPELLPHPDDIVLNPSTGDAWINGPESPEDVKFYEHTIELRNFCLLLDSQAEKSARRKNNNADEPTYSGALIMAQLLDAILPPRYRWQDGEEVMLLMRCLDLTKRERKRRIADECARLEATQPPTHYLTPELKWEVNRLTDKVIGNKSGPSI